MDERTLAKDEAQTPKAKSYKGCGCLVIVLVVLALFVAFRIPYYVSAKRVSCDRAAMDALTKISEGFLKLSEEAKGTGIEWDERAIGIIAANKGLHYMTGSHYGWGGCYEGCGVLIRMRKDGDSWIVEGSALQGTHPTGPQTRYVFARTVVGGQDRKTAIEAVTNLIDAGDGDSRNWNSYPRKDPSGEERCYCESMVQKGSKGDPPGLAIREPMVGPCPPRERPTLNWGVILD